ncbi:B-cell antigen receptor complex-associated protein beta chain [Eublepharis macularius]|uniref:B-cell antigen receptor complex-associated protein beta chain n=1 Tax=Eublepharis macularius TaxID=481883 RepID=A0AA97K4A9_EUBMA|nr:B-cell antigen receptor complex-associated protein beta chain [Eublepharis macularius]
MATTSFQVLWATLWICLVTSESRVDRLKNPRFIAVRWGSRVSFSCGSSSVVNWYKKIGQDPRQLLENSSRVLVINNSSVSTINIAKLQHTDSGIYYCESSGSNKSMSMQQHCGTELKIMGISTYQQVQDRNTMKDTIILIQSILLFMFVSFPVFMILGKGDGKEAPGEDHTYEGLAVELADTYEDIGTYQDRAEKWDLGEHPSEE